jgi:hypothetical protein
VVVLLRLIAASLLLPLDVRQHYKAVSEQVKNIILLSEGIPQTDCPECDRLIDRALLMRR